LVQELSHGDEFLVELGQDGFVLLLKFFPVAFELLFCVLDALNFLIEDFHVLVIVSGDVVDRVFGGYNSVFLVGGRVVNTVDTE
jgi:hypothetical protein